MHAYVGVRMRVEALLREANQHTVGFGRCMCWGPAIDGRTLLPMYWLFGALPSTRRWCAATGGMGQRLEQMIGALTWAVETAGTESRVIGVPEIRDRGSR